ncbi:hypothetical protein K1Y78_50575 [Streptomyces sp. tea 10]|nr:hypothetical protein [Streptomyces sp. tea 10]
MRLVSAAAGAGRVVVPDDDVARALPRHGSPRRVVRCSHHPDRILYGYLYA